MVHFLTAGYTETPCHRIERFIRKLISGHWRQYQMEQLVGVLHHSHRHASRYIDALSLQGGSRVGEANRLLHEDRSAQMVTWRGMEAGDPKRPGRTMCLDKELPREAIRAGVQAALACIACPLNQECGYQAQREAAAKADIVIGAHNLAFDQLPSGLPKAAALIIDEGFHQAGLHGLDPKHPVQLLVGALDEHRTPNLTGTRRQRLLNLRLLVKEAIEGQEPGQLHRSP